MLTPKYTYANDPHALFQTHTTWVQQPRYFPSPSSPLISTPGDYEKASSTKHGVVVSIALFSLLGGAGFSLLSFTHEAFGIGSLIFGFTGMMEGTCFYCIDRKESYEWLAKGLVGITFLASFVNFVIGVMSILNLAIG